MIFEKVNFNERVIKATSYEDFEAKHIGVLWQNRDEATRKKMLTEVYNLITSNRRRKQKN